MSSNETVSGPVESSIRKKLEAGLNPQHCDIINESYMHNAPKGSESHFKVVVVSEKFDKQPLLKVDIIRYHYPLITRHCVWISSNLNFH